MPTADAAVGMMDAAYFVGRKELLDWLNSLLDLRLNKIEETATGAIACQIFDIMYPDAIPMSRVNWEARSDYEYVSNYKLLQNGFTKHHVQRHVDVPKLIRAKYQDNLEFMQWFKAFYDNSGSHGGGGIDGYVPSAVRARGKGGKKFNAAHGGGGARSVSSSTNRSAASSSRNSSRASGRSTTSSSAPTAAARGGGNSTRTTSDLKPKVTTAKEQRAPDSPRSSRPLRERAAANESKCNIAGKANAEAGAALLKQNADLQSKVDDLEAQNGELQTKALEFELAVLEIEKERDFYFEKLRNVEVMLQVHQEKGEGDSNPTDLVDKIFKVLYATAEDPVAVDDEGELVDGSFFSQERGEEERDAAEATAVETDALDAELDAM